MEASLTRSGDLDPRRDRLTIMMARDGIRFMGGHFWVSGCVIVIPRNIQAIGVAILGLGIERPSQSRTIGMRTSTAFSINLTAIPPGIAQGR